MTLIRDLIQEGDLFSLLFLIALLCFIGNKMVHSQPTMATWGMRIAIGVFLLFAVVSIASAESLGASELVGIVLASLAAAGLVLGPVWIVLAVLGFMYAYYRRATQASRQAADQRRRQRDERKQEKRRQREQAEWERQSPQREAEAREAEHRRQLDVSRKVDENQRREDARAACDLLYNLREPDIAGRFSREQLDQFMEKYMADGKPVAVVERRAKELQRLIHEHFEAVKPSVKFANLAELTAWYEDQKQQIEGLPISDLYKADQLVRLNERYSDLMERVMEALQQ